MHQIFLINNELLRIVIHFLGLILEQNMYWNIYNNLPAKVAADENQLFCGTPVNICIYMSLPVS